MNNMTSLPHIKWGNGNIRALCLISNESLMAKQSSSDIKTKEDANATPSFWQILLSTFAAAFGVQNRKNLEKDFKHGDIKVYILAGVLFTAVFVFTVILVVNIVLQKSGL